MRAADRPRDSRGRFIREPEEAAARLWAPPELRQYGRESAARLRAIADDPDTPAKLKADIERFFFEAVYGKTPLADREEKGTVETVRFEGKLEEWSQ